MNFNVGGFSESLKYSYQQFCKQDAEARDHSRRLLVKLKKFEAKSFDLIAQTQTAQHIRNQYERMLMQQNPLLWAQLQRNITMDVTDYELEPQLTAHHSGLKFTREIAINTSNNSTTSDQHSLQEEGVWPHTPSPQPAIETRPSTNQTKNVFPLDQGSNLGNYKAADKSNNSVSYTEQSTKQILSTAKQERSQAQDLQQSIPDIYPPQRSLSNTARVEKEEFLPPCSSTPNLFVKKENPYPSATFIMSTEEADITRTLVNKGLPTDKTFASSVAQDQEQIEKQYDALEEASSTQKVIDILAASDPFPHISQRSHIENETSEPAIQDKTTAVVQEILPVKSNDNEIKPFRLDSESDCVDEPSFSGPLSGKNLEGDDSDSFWN